jgi:hypothetical protein
LLLKINQRLPMGQWLLYFNPFIVCTWNVLEINRRFSSPFVVGYYFVKTMFFNKVLLRLLQTT